MTEAPYLVVEFHEAQDNSLLVTTGDAVEKGTPLGKPGATGSSSGIRVHFPDQQPENQCARPASDQ